MRVNGLGREEKESKRDEDLTGLDQRWPQPGERRKKTRPAHPHLLHEGEGTGL